MCFRDLASKLASTIEKPQFVPFSSFTDPAFWSQLTQRKLNEYKLSEQAQSLWGYFLNSDAPLLPCRHYVEFDSFDVTKQQPTNGYLTHGSVIVLNTIDAFKAIDKQLLINEEGQKIMNDVASGKAYEDPSLLCRFILLCFVDIKTYNFTYWFSFPAVCIPDEVCYSQPPLLLGAVFSPEHCSEIQKRFSEYLRQSRQAFFLLIDLGAEHKAEQRFQVEPLVKLQDTAFIDAVREKLSVVFCDPSTAALYPGWPLRNLLALLASRSSHPIDDIRVICWRNRFAHDRLECSHSLLLHLQIKGISTLNGQPRVVGWEKNEKGALGPRLVNLSSSMDPFRLAENAVNLNLQLMRWRIVPDLDLEKISRTKCLLFGAGTLGSSVARCLLAWGIREITFVDNSKVNYNNPVRQSLFNFEDCVGGIKRKAHTAADNLKKIFPQVKSEGYDVHVPMPGYLISEKESTEVQKTVALLDKLVQSHDVAFLLTDTRESRWLPTLLCTLHSKICFSVALGFDSYVVIRHGFGRAKLESKEHSVSLKSPKAERSLSGSELGCYFCTDVVAPGNSQKDRTLDQQCTVTRPGLSLIASALAVELMVSLLQHPLGPLASADTADVVHASSEDNPLSIVPHQIRGFLSRFDHMTPCVQRFPSCIACSEKVLLRYDADGFNFLLQVFNNPTTLESITGLLQLQQDCEDVDVLDFDDESICSMDST